MSRRLSGFLILVSLLGCSGLVIDPSPSASASGDLTLALKACEGPLFSGFGVCRVKEGTDIDSAWQAVLPKLKGGVQGGEVTVRMRDKSISYPVDQDGVAVIPMRDFFGPKKWEKADNSIGNLTGKMRVVGDDGIERILQVEGQILVRVLAIGYDPMAVDSGFKAWGNECKVEYSTAGRSAVNCE